MISGIGVDIAEIARFKRLVTRYGDSFAHRILTDQEFNQYLKRKRSASFLASRFAAKEAASKAIGTGLSGGIWFHSIEVANDRSGKPELLFHDQADSHLKARKINHAMLSLSDEKHYVVAMVVLEITG